MIPIDPLDPLDDPLRYQPHEATRLALRHAIVADLQPTKARSLASRGLAVALVGVFAVAVAVASFGVGGLTRAATAMPLALGSGAIVAAAAASMFGFGPSSDGSFRKKRQWLLALALLSGWSFMLWFIHDPATRHSVLTPTGAACALRGAMSSLLATGGLLWIWRRTDPWTPHLSGAVLGTTAGVLAAAGISMGCGGNHAGHLLWGHWLLVPLSAIVGTLVAPRILRP
ncbi:MAG TPA: DUF1109 domain-containing protein [Sorangium sp.]|nr:DUF1109 domain-containing protein [Sorangium sp.]